jgi:hypothetical protein
MEQYNKPEPFTSVPVLNGGGCRNQTNNRPRQLTFCVIAIDFIYIDIVLTSSTKKEKIIQ